MRLDADMVNIEVAVLELGKRDLLHSPHAMKIKTMATVNGLMAKE